jgi:hypothetical protein
MGFPEKRNSVGKRGQQFSSIFISDNKDAADESDRKRAKGCGHAENFLKDRAYKQRAGASRRKNNEKIIMGFEATTCSQQSGGQTFRSGTLQSGAAVPEIGQEDFITKEEVARRLKKTTRTVENWQRRGYIPFVKVQQSVLFRWSSVVAQLERRFGVGFMGQG